MPSPFPGHRTNIWSNIVNIANMSWREYHHWEKIKLVVFMQILDPLFCLVFSRPTHNTVTLDWPPLPDSESRVNKLILIVAFCGRLPEAWILRTVAVHCIGLIYSNATRYYGYWCYWHIIYLLIEIDFVSHQAYMHWHGHGIWSIGLGLRGQKRAVRYLSPRLWSVVL